MAYLNFTTEEKSNTCFKFIGCDNKPKTTNLISNRVSLLSSNDCGNDTCTFYSGPSDAAILAFGESYESCGSIASIGGESCGSVAYSGGGESCGSVASSSSGFSGGGCSYSC